jgi:anaerobic ribonucleoside-triphosphate reductase
MENKEVTLNDSERTRCEVWSRVMGYHRPVSSWNIGKKEEHKERLCFTEAKAMKSVNQKESIAA